MKKNSAFAFSLLNNVSKSTPVGFYSSDLEIWVKGSGGSGRPVADAGREDNTTNPSTTYWNWIGSQNGTYSQPFDDRQSSGYDYGSGYGYGYGYGYGGYGGYGGYWYC